METAARLGGFLGLNRARYRLFGPVRLAYGQPWNGANFYHADAPQDPHVTVQLTADRPGDMGNLVALLACEIARSKTDARFD